MSKKHELDRLPEIIDFLRIHFNVFAKSIEFVDREYDILVRNGEKHYTIEVKTLKIDNDGDHLGRFIFTQKDKTSGVDFFLLVIDMKPFYSFDFDGLKFTTHSLSFLLIEPAPILSFIRFFRSYVHERESG